MAEKTAAKKANPFEKLAKEKAAASTAAPETEEQVVAEAKERVAAKRAVRAKSAKKAEPEEAPEADIEETEELEPTEPETDEEETGDADSEEGETDAEDEDDDIPAVLADGAGEAPEPQVKKAPAKRRTAKQVEEEAAEREAKLQEQIDELKRSLEGKADSLDIGVVQDRIVLEGGVGGDVRVVGNGKSLANDDWRATVDGLALLLGRSSTQATQQFKLPLVLIPSLVELLGELSEITE